MCLLIRPENPFFIYRKFEKMQLLRSIGLKLKRVFIFLENIVLTNLAPLQRNMFLGSIFNMLVPPSFSGHF